MPNAPAGFHRPARVVPVPAAGAAENRRQSPGVVTSPPMCRIVRLTCRDPAAERRRPRWPTSGWVAESSRVDRYVRPWERSTNFPAAATTSASRIDFPVRYDAAFWPKDRLPGVANDVNANRRPDINVGNVNVGNSVDYSKDQQAWVNNRHVTGNAVRERGQPVRRYASGRVPQGCRRRIPLLRGVANRGPYYGWRATNYAYLGASALPLGPILSRSTTPTEPVATSTTKTTSTCEWPAGRHAGAICQQIQAAVAAAPATVSDPDWLPLGAFAFTREGVDDSQAMIELAVNKQGVIAGTYYNEATGVSRPLKGTVDRKTQRGDRLCRRPEPGNRI